MSKLKVLNDSNSSDKVILFDIRAERSLLAAILRRNDAILDATRIIVPSDFYQTRHRVIYELVARYG